MHTVLNLEDISLGTRQRTVDEGVQAHIAELARDIGEIGLIHAPTVKEGNELTAGFCRMQACKLQTEPYYYAGSMIAPGFIPVVQTHLTSVKDLHQLELHENIRRRNLSPMDEARAIARLHKFRQELDVTWSEKKTGQLLDDMKGVSRHEKVAQREVEDSLLIDAYSEDPDVKKASSRKEAVKIVKRKFENQLRASLGELRQQTNLDFLIESGDCRVLLPGFVDNTFHGIVCDPPYGIDADKFGEQTMKGEGHVYKDSEEYAFSVIESILVQGFRICKDNAHLYMFCDIRAFPDIYARAMAIGWMVFPTPLIWNKVNSGHAPWPGYFGRRYEAILFAQKGNRALSKTRSDIFEFPAVKEKVHAAEKPEELLKELLSLSFFPGEAILDPCLGSGSIILPIRDLKLRLTGIELDENWVNHCKNKVGEL